VYGLGIQNRGITLVPVANPIHVSSQLAGSCGLGAISIHIHSQCSQASSPSVFGSGLDGRQYLKERPGRTGILASIQTTARDGLAGTAGVSGGAISRVTRGDGRALQVIGEDWRRPVRTAEDG